jgi:hypothetical protein
VHYEIDSQKKSHSEGLGMNLAHAVDAIKKRLEATSGPGSSAQVAWAVTELERLLLDDAYPDECLQLIIDTISSPRLSSIRGIQRFIASLFSDMSRLTQEQKTDFLTACRANLPRLQQVELCWALCDLIARNYPKDVAITFFSEVSGEAQLSAMEGVMLGLDILRMHNKDDRAVSDAIARIASQDAPC